MRTSNVLNDGKETGYGFGLFVDEQGGVKRVQHGGSDVAHRSMFVFYPDLHAGLTVQSNDARFGSNVAARIAEAFFEEIKSEEEAEEAAGEFDPAKFDVTLYQIGNNPYHEFVYRAATAAMNNQ